MSTRELFGDSSSSDDDNDENEKVEPAVQTINEKEGTNKGQEDPASPTKAAAAEAVGDDDRQESKERNKEHSDPMLQDSEDEDEGDVEFDDGGAIVGLSSTTIAGTRTAPARQPSPVRNRDSDDEDERDDNEEAAAPAAPIPVLKWTLPEITQPLLEQEKNKYATTFHMTKLPNLVGIQTEAFDPDTYSPHVEEEDFGGAAHNLIRWRYKTKEGGGGDLARDPATDKLLRESNTRLVEWEDGSMSLHIGSEAFIVDSYRTASDNFNGINGFLYLSQKASVTDNPDEAVGTLLESLGPIDSRMTIRPISLQSQAHKSLTHAVRQKTIKQSRIAEIATQHDPEKIKQERIKVKADLDKANQRKQLSRAGYGGGGGGARRPRMNRSYMEDEDDEDYDTTNIKSLKRGAFQDDYDENDHGEEEEDDDGVFHTVASTKRGRAARAAASSAQKADSSDDDVNVGGDEEDDEEVNLAKNRAKKQKFRQAVFDDDDDDSD